jgi:hypothetical protein
VPFVGQLGAIFIQIVGHQLREIILLFTTTILTSLSIYEISSIGE